MLSVVRFILAFTVVGQSYSRGPYEAALIILNKSPVIDGHIDLPWLARERFANNITAFDLNENTTVNGHVDIPRLRQGRVGGFFWSVYVPCARDIGMDDGVNFTNPTYRVRDTLEQIDVARLLIEEYSDTFSLSLTSNDLRHAIHEKKIGSMIGVEGGHQLGNSLGALRTYHSLGVRYITLTHSCHNAFADSCGIFEVPEPVHGGLSPFGRELVREMNRLGILLDLSHTSDDTAIQALELSEAPVIWSHSSARAVFDVPRNVPDNILEKIGRGKGKKDAVVMINFAPYFIAAPGNATVKAVADHVEHIAKVAGKKHVGIGSDYDGIGETPIGLEDASTYPVLFAELIRRGWTQPDLEALAGGNLIRVWQGAEEVSKKLQRRRGPSMVIYDKRTDIQVPSPRIVRDSEEP